jgi:DNA (cytosine-5)-methyltransferase 1
VAVTDDAERRPVESTGNQRYGSAPGRDESNCDAKEHRGSGYWAAFDIVHCTDGKARRIEPGSFPLAHGIPARVGRLRGYGNAISPQITAEFIAACMEAAHA